MTYEKELFQFIFCTYKETSIWVAAELDTEHSRDSQVFVQKCLFDLAVALSNKNNYYNNRLFEWLDGDFQVFHKLPRNMNYWSMALEFDGLSKEKLGTLRHDFYQVWKPVR